MQRQTTLKSMKKIYDVLMLRKEYCGKNLIDLACKHLIEKEDERFLLFILENTKQIDKYIYRCDERGELPLFKVFHYFTTQYSEMKTLQSSSGSDIDMSVDDSDVKGRKILETLFRIKYDFTRNSESSRNGQSNINSLEMMMMQSMDITIFEQIVEFVALNQSDKYVTMVDQIKDKSGRFCDVLFSIQTDVRMTYLRCLVEIQYPIYQKLQSREIQHKGRRVQFRMVS